MTSIVIISVASFAGTIALIVAVASLITDRQDDGGLNRLEQLASTVRPESKAGIVKDEQIFDSIWLNKIESFLTRLITLNYLVEQAGLKLSTTAFFSISFGCACLGTALALILSAPLPMIPIVGIVFLIIPILWLMHMRTRRLSLFASQLPEALELISRGLRSGNSLSASIGMISQEMLAPVSFEFEKATKQQELGRSVVDSLEDMTRRIPNDDLKFFHTSVKLQQRFGGNLAEILDTISSIVRERQQIVGQVQALTGEGRLSGIVLLLLPIVVFFAIYYISPDYVTPLFSDPIGQKALATSIVLQLLGAYTIKKIVDIKI